MILVSKYCVMRRHTLIEDGKLIFESNPDLKYSEFLAAVYRNLQLQYPKFFKMDELSKTGFLAAEVLLSGRTDNRNMQNENMPVYMICRSSSLETDENFELTTGAEYFPSPSVFVYTLPNIVLGEIAIKNKLYGENTCFVCEDFANEIVFDYICQGVRSACPNEALVLFIDQYDGVGEVLAVLISEQRNENDGITGFTIEHINELLNKH